MNSHVQGREGVEPGCITDGAGQNSSIYFQKSSSSTVGSPYMLEIDMKKSARISEFNLSTRLDNGSETAYKYTIEGSLDGKNYQMLVDSRRHLKKSHSDTFYSVQNGMTQTKQKILKVIFTNCFQGILNN